MGLLLVSIIKLIISLATLGFAIFLGLKLEPDKDLADRALLMFGVGLSTCSPIGLFLYVKFWESRPEFSSACGKQAILGLACFTCLFLINHVFPNSIGRW